MKLYITEDSRCYRDAPSGMPSKAVDVADDISAQTCYVITALDGNTFATLSMQLACNAMQPIAGCKSVHMMEIE